MKYIFGNNNLISDLVKKERKKKKKRISFNRGKRSKMLYKEGQTLDYGL
jgi:hypothetical protein